VTAASSSFFERHPSLSALGVRDFRLLLAGTALVGLVGPLQIVTQVFWTQEEFGDNSVRYASIIAGSRGAAMVLFAFLGGAIADRFDRRRVLLVGESVALVNHGIVAAFMITVPFGAWTVAPVAAFSFIGSGVQAVDLPARQASIPSIVGMDRLSNAISLNTLAMQLMIGIGLPATGLLNEAVSPGMAYLASLLVWALILPLIAALRFSSTGGARRGNMLRNVADGLKYSARSRIILGVVATMVVATLIGMPGITIPFGPIWITEELGQSEAAFGFIATTWGLGAIAGAFVATRVRGLTERGLTLVLALVLVGLAVAVFGHVKLVPGAVLGNIMHGFSIAVLNVTSATIVQHTAVEAMRGRVMSLFPLLQGLSQLSIPLYGELVDRNLVALTVLIPALGWTTVACALLVANVFPGLARLRAEPRVAGASAGG
jgi:MFS family permease